MTDIEDEPWTLEEVKRAVREVIVERDEAILKAVQPSVLERSLDEFRDEMLAKFVRRKDKHPGESSVTDDNYDWAATSLEDLEHHLVSEFVERFPQYRNRFPELNQADITVDAKETEDVDMANLCFADWKARKARIIDAKPEKKP